MPRDNDHSTKPTRIAAVQFLNTITLIEGLNTWDGCRLVKAVPARIAPMLTANETDVGLASIVDALNPENDLALIPSGMIGCDGPTLTVRLFSSVPIEQITRVHADTDSHTSVMLADLLLREQHDIAAEFVEFDARERMSIAQSRDVNPDEAWPETLLIIGDKVVADSPPAIRYPHQIDLGEAWHALTGLPFVYACWMCRDDLGSTMIDEAAAMLERVRLRNDQRLDWLVTREAAAHSWPADLARTYIGQLLSFNVDDRARQAVERFATMLREHAILDAKQPRWVTSNSTHLTTP